ncbi:MAG TPA: M23 family metallopeptidase [Rhizomicrobium sp.]
MNRRSESTLESFVSEWRRTARAASATLSTPDGRWALLSTSMTTVVAGAIAWLAAGAATPGDTYQVRRERSLVPYQLFMQLAARSNSSTSYASFAPAPAQTGTPAAVAQRATVNPMDGQIVDEADNNFHPSSVDTRTLTLDKGDTLVGALTDAGVSATDAHAAVAAMQSVYDPRAVKAGETIDITYSVPEPKVANIISVTDASLNSIDASDEDTSASTDFSSLAPSETTQIGNLLKISFSPTVEHEVTITRGTDGSYAAQDVVRKLVEHTHRAGATIDSSLYATAVQAGVPTDVVVDMIRVLSYKVDFQRDLHPGDKFEVLYDYYSTEDGQPAKPGNISFVSIDLGDRTVSMYRYQANPNEPAEYFDATGQSTKGFLMKTPVDGARITSGFGMRFHPVLGYSRMHKGIDFGVPVGTPVMAAGGGTVQLAGHLGGYGNYLRINHGNGYSTAYGHLSRMAPGIHIGSRVRQGQVVAYSGNTGLSTGPHLHYEILVGNDQVNPLTVKVAMGQKLAGADLHKFLDMRIHTDDVLASMPLEQRMADQSSDLRSAKAQ